MIQVNSLTYEERCKYFATGKATVGKITQVIDRQLVDFYVGRVRSVVCTNADGEYKFLTYDEAQKCARNFIEHARKCLQHPQPADM